MSSWLGEGNLQVRWPIATGGWIAWVSSCVSAGFLGWQILHISTAQTLHIITYFALLEDDLISKPEFKLAFSLAATDLILVSCNSPMQVEVKHWVLEELSIFPFCVCRAQSICSNCSRQTWRSMLYDIMRSLHDRFWNNSNLWCLLLLSCHIHLVVLRLSFCLAIPCPHSFCVCWFGFHGCTWRCDQGNLKMLLYATLFCGFPLCTMLCSIEALTAGATDAMNRSRWEWVNWLKTRKIMAPNLFFSARGSSFLEEEAWAILRPITICSFSVARLGANKFVP